MRFGFNVDGNHLGDERYFHGVIERLLPSWILITNNMRVAVDAYDTTDGQTDVIHRVVYPHDGNEWNEKSPQSYAAEIMARGNKSLWRYISHRPQVNNDVRDAKKMSDWLATAVEAITDSGYKVVVGNFLVDSLKDWMLNRSTHDRLLKVLSERRSVAKVGVHEYAGMALPFSGEGYDRWNFLDRESVQPGKWPTLTSKNGEHMLGDYVNERVPTLTHLLRSHWLQRRVVDTLKLSPVEFIVTEFGWDRKTDWSTGRNHIYDAIKRRYGDSGYGELAGPYTLTDLWKYYWPEWSVSAAILEQLKWADGIYSDDYLSLLLFSWSFADDNVKNGSNFGSDRELHELLIEWAEQIRNEQAAQSQIDELPVDSLNEELFTAQQGGNTVTGIKSDFSNIVRNYNFTGFEFQEFVYEKNGRRRTIERPLEWRWVYFPKTSDPGEVPEVYHRDPSGFVTAGGYIPWHGGIEQENLTFVKGQRYLARTALIPQFTFASAGNFKDNIQFRFAITPNGSTATIYSPWLWYGGNDWHMNQIEMLWAFESTETFTGKFRFEVQCHWGNTDGDILWNHIACQNAPADYANNSVTFITPQIVAPPTPDPIPTPDPTPIPSPVPIPGTGEIDILPYIMGSGQVYDVGYWFPGLSTPSGTPMPEQGVERMQTWRESKTIPTSRKFFHVKGGPGSQACNWEELAYSNYGIWRGTDISPNEDELYQASENGRYGQMWLPRFVKVGTRHLAQPTITFRKKNTGENVPEKPPYPFPNWIEVVGIYERYTFPNGITLNNVIELHGRLHDPVNIRPGTVFEKYWYGGGLGLVAWEDPLKGREDPVTKQFVTWKSYVVNPAVASGDLPRRHIPWLQLGQLPPPGVDNVLPDFFPITDSRWQRCYLSSVGSTTNVRARPLTSATIIGTVQKDAAALILEAEKRTQSDGIWYPVRINSKPGMSHPDSDYSNSGWVRSDVVTFRPYVPPPPPEPTPTDGKRISTTVDYLAGNDEHALLVTTLKNILLLLAMAGATVNTTESQT